MVLTISPQIQCGRWLQPNELRASDSDFADASAGVRHRQKRPWSERCKCSHRSKPVKSKGFDSKRIGCHELAHEKR
eukprot:1154892-Pelagomonas_calceolata.AAC.4